MTQRNEVLQTLSTPSRANRSGTPIAPANTGRVIQVQRQKEDKRAAQRAPSRAPIRHSLVLLLVGLVLGILSSSLAGRSLLTKATFIALLHRLPSFISLHTLIIAGSIVAIAGGSMIAVFIGLACSIVNTLTRPKMRDHFIPLTPFLLDLPAEEVMFPPREGNYLVRGLYIARPGATTTVLISPGYRRGLADVLGICKHLWNAGHTILAFEYYGHGAIVGTPVTLGYREVHDFLGAVAYARQRIPHASIGALGYSMGGAISIMGSAQTPDVLAVVADSAFASHWSAVEFAVRRTLHLPPGTFRRSMNALRWITDRLLSWRAGYRSSQVEPWRAIAHLAPRPVLLIHGLDDTVVHPQDSIRLYEAAGHPKSLWHVPGTEHIKAYFTDSPQYITTLISFFDQSLKLPHSVALHQDAACPVATLSEEEVASAPPRYCSDSQMQKDTPACSSFGQSCGRFIYQLRWVMIALWMIVLLGSIPLASRVQQVLHNSGYSIQGSESQTVDTLLTAQLHQPATQIQAMFQSSTMPVADRAYQHELHDFLARAQRFPHVTSVTQQGIGKDGRSALVTIGFDQEKDAVASLLPAFRTLLPTEQAGPARVYLTGEAAVANEIQLDTQSDTETAELIALPLTLLVLLVVFRSVVAGLMPLLLAMVTVSSALAIIYLLALQRETNMFIQSLVSIIGLGLSIDYSLFFIRRFREELEHGSTVAIAVAWTMATAGEAILFSAMTVAIGFAGLLFIHIQIMESFGMGGIIVASMAALSALTLLPAVLSVIGQHINALSLPLLHRTKPAHTRHMHLSEELPGSTFWQAWAHFVMKRPVLILLFIGILLLGLGWPALSLTPGLPGASSLPPTSEARQGLDLLNAQFPAVNADPIELVAQTSDGSSILTAQNIARITSLTRWLTEQRHITDVISLTKFPLPPRSPALSEQQLTQLYESGAYQHLPALRQLVARSASGNTTLLMVRADTIAGSHDDELLIDHLRAIPSQVAHGLLLRVGGARAIDLDFHRTLYRDFLHSLIFLLVATYLLLLFTFRSILLPLKAILMNLLSLSGAYGALVFVFQQGHFEQLLGFTASGSLDRFIPIVLFCTIFGLSMDYEVFLLTRMRESWLRLGNNRAAVALGLEKTGGVITSAAFLFMIVSGAFIFARLIVTKELGLGITIAVFVDATLIRLLLVPATMQLLGRWNWWFPRWFAIASLHRRNHTLSDQPATHAPLKVEKGTLKQALFLPQPSAIEQILIQMVARLRAVPAEQLCGTSNFFDHGGDSETLTALIVAINQQWGISLEANDIFDHPVLHHLASLIAQKQQSQREGTRP